jgi:uncharacterized membrane protein
MDEPKETQSPMTKRECLHAVFGTPAAACLRLLASYFLVAGIFILANQLDNRPAIADWMNYIAAVPFPWVMLYTLFCFALSTALRCFLRWEPFDRTYILYSTVFFLLFSLWRANGFPAAIAGLLLLFAIAHYALDRRMIRKARQLSRRACLLLVSASTLLVVAFTGITQMYRYKIFGTSCFDLGIFVQMYHSMITNGTLQVTCERSETISHLAVHASPIFYLLAPLYFLFPKAETLLLVQPVIVFSGILPLYWIAKHRKLSPWVTLCLCIVYLFSSCLIGPCYFDFHENAFLPPLLMWVFWGIERKKWWVVYLSGILVLLVKEDAPLYMICIGLYLFSGKISRLHGSIITVLSGIYFCVVTALLKQYGDGVMITRFSNFYLEEDGTFSELLSNAISNPAYFLSSLISESALAFFFMVMIPLCFLPFLTKKLYRYFLMVPFLIMNLLVSASYAAAASVNYQYVFGTWVCLFYLAFLNWQDLKPSARKKLISAMACISFFSSYTMFSKNVCFREQYVWNKAHYIEMETVLARIPEDASVACDDWHVSHLANRAVIYQLNATTATEPSTTDFVVVRQDLGDDQEKEWIQDERKKLKKEGYTVWDSVEDTFEIYVSPEYAAANLT